tara:strand:- start:819 stop:1193 length:375 start_codon:yes stop_codon:yes gene_type:complete
MNETAEDIAERLKDENQTAPQPVSPEALKVLANILNVATENNMMKDTDSSRIQAILKVNPSLRLSNLARRLNSIKRMLKEMKSYDSRFDILLERSDEELQGIEIVSQMLPNFKPLEEEQAREDN